MRKLTSQFLVFAVSVMSLESFAYLQTPPERRSANDISEVLKVVEQTLPRTGEYVGRDQQNKSCTLIVDRLNPLIRVSIMPAWGGFSVLRDESQAVEEFKTSEGLFYVKVRTSESLGGGSVVSYGVLKVLRLTQDMVQYSVGSIRDLQKPNPKLVSCTIQEILPRIRKSSGT